MTVEEALEAVRAAEGAPAVWSRLGKNSGKREWLARFEFSHFATTIGDDVALIRLAEFGLKQRAEKVTP